MERKGEMCHKSDRAQVTGEAKEKLKYDEMNVDVDTESAETKSSKKEVGSSGIIRNTRCRRQQQKTFRGRSSRS